LKDQAGCAASACSRRACAASSAVAGTRTGTGAQADRASSKVQGRSAVTTPPPCRRARGGARALQRVEDMGSGKDALKMAPRSGHAARAAYPTPRNAMPLLALGLNHQTAPINLREKV